MNATEKIAQAKKVALGRIRAADVRFMRVSAAREEIAVLNENIPTLLFAGPPLSYRQLPAVVQDALSGAVVYEGWAKDVHEASNMLRAGNVRLFPGDDYDAAGRGAGVISPSMPTAVFFDLRSGCRAVITIGQGFKEHLDGGYNGEDVVLRLKWLENVLRPILNAALQYRRGYNMTLLAQKYPRGGKEAIASFVNSLEQAIRRVSYPIDQKLAVIDYMKKDASFYLNALFGAMKAATLGAKKMPYCNLITTACSNGAYLGLKYSAGEKWYLVPLSEVDGDFDPTKEVVLGDLYLGKMDENDLDSLAAKDYFTLDGEIYSRMAGIGFSRVGKTRVKSAVIRLMRKEFSAAHRF